MCVCCIKCFCRYKEKKRNELHEQSRDTFISHAACERNEIEKEKNIMIKKK